MIKPPTPGSILLNLYIKPHGMNITELAWLAGIDRKELSNIVHGKRSITTRNAIKLSQVFCGTGPAYWLTLQMNMDIWVELNKMKEERDVS